MVYNYYYAQKLKSIQHKKYKILARIKASPGIQSCKID